MRARLHLKGYNNLWSEDPLANLSGAVHAHQFSLVRFQKAEGLTLHGVYAEALRDHKGQTDTLHARQPEADLLSQEVREILLIHTAGHDASDFYLGCLS